MSTIDNASILAFHRKGNAPVTFAVPVGRAVLCAPNQ